MAQIAQYITLKNITPHIKATPPVIAIAAKSLISPAPIPCLVKKETTINASVQPAHANTLLTTYERAPS